MESEALHGTWGYVSQIAVDLGRRAAENQIANRSSRKSDILECTHNMNFTKISINNV